MATSHTPDRFIALPFRRGDKDLPDWMMCWKYISTNHSSSASTNVKDTLQSMQAEHTTIVKTCQTGDSKQMPNMSFVQHTLTRYCQQVAMLQAHIPLHNGKVNRSLKFVWRDSFDESVKYESDNANSELVSCIYNLAASYNFVGGQRAQAGTVEDVKEAYRLFQDAAGYYTMVEGLLDRVPPAQLTKGDLKRDSLTMLIRISMAEATHCAYLKAEDAMKGNQDMLAKLAAEAAKIYEDADSLMRTSSWFTTRSLISIHENTSKDVENQLQTNALVFRARACLHMAQKNEKDLEMGVAIAYYQKAKDHLAKAPRQPTTALQSWLNGIVKCASDAAAKAQKANDSVYYARIPKEVPEPEGLPRPLGQPTTHASFVAFESKRGEDPFFGIVPAHIAAIATTWRDKQRKLVTVADSSASTTRRSTQEKLQQLGVIAAIQTLSGETEDRGRVPEPLRTNILKLREGPNGEQINVVQHLTELVTTCDQLYQVAVSKLKEVDVEFAKEKETDKRYIDSYGQSMWRSVYPAAESTPDYNALNAAVAEHRNGLQQWLAAPFSAAKETLKANVQNTARLGWAIADLDALMPFVKTKEAREQSGKVKGLVAQLKEIMEKKEQLEKEQRNHQKNLQNLLESDQVVFGLSAVDPTQQDSVLAKASQEVNDAIEAVNQKSREEAALLREAESVMVQLGSVQSEDPIVAEIQKVTNSLENSVTTYREMCTEMENIVQYATKAIDSIESTLGSAQSFRLGRELDAQERMSALDSQIAIKMSQMASQPQARPPSGGQMQPPQQHNYQQQYQPQQQQQQQYQYPPQQQTYQPQQQTYQPQQQQYQPQQQQQQTAPSYDRPPSYDQVYGGAQQSQGQQQQQPPALHSYQMNTGAPQTYQPNQGSAPPYQPPRF